MRRAGHPLAHHLQSVVCCGDVLERARVAHSPGSKAIRQIAAFVAAEGLLLVISRGRDESDNPGKMPWPLL